MVGMIKPDAGIYQCLFDKYILNPKECVFIDDRPENIEGGRKLGMEGIVFTDYELSLIHIFTLKYTKI